MRTLSLPLALAALAGCSQSPDAKAAPAGQKIDCALDGTQAFETSCTVEKVGNGGEFIIHHPDGGFRRFITSPDGAFEVTDGADELIASEDAGGERITFAVGRDRYAVPSSGSQEKGND
ncbi:hypothetical protein [Qipengyuania spongiae]|uniref:Lysozyme inhibitor n=1 Tax=Qipengyuania spongiae TaxID=2909673 RepID=A0ABY5SWS1_9SPHN|nr:hypothetical protein [Qipengyuania spongiae]UVI38997.1 hypothetical protein L1F33_12265 [Qipengyuania spongiae]